MTEIPEDFVDLIRCLRETHSDFAVVGAYALAFHGHPRATQDIDIWIRPDPDNAKKVFRALEDFGAPLRLHGVNVKDFAQPGNVYQIGLPPIRIDVLTALPSKTRRKGLSEVASEAKTFSTSEFGNKSSTNVRPGASKTLPTWKLSKRSSRVRSPEVEINSPAFAMLGRRFCPTGSVTTAHSRVSLIVPSTRGSPPSGDPPS